MAFVDHFEPGKVIVDGAAYEQDVMIWQGDVMTWFRVDFDELHEADLQFLLSQSAAEIIVGLGPAGNRVFLDDDTRAALAHWPSNIVFLGSEQAVAAFNASGGEAALVLRVRTSAPFER